MRRTPPLWVWALSPGLAAGAALLLVLSTDHNKLPEQQEANIAAAYAKQVLDAPRAPGDIRVLGIGSSLLMAATPPTGHTASHLRWKRLSNPGLGIDFLGASLALVEQNPPDVLVVEKNLLLVDPQHQAMGRLRATTALALKKIVAMVTSSPEPAAPADSAATALKQQNENFSCPMVAQPANKLGFNNYIHFLNTTYSSLQVDPSLSAALQRLSVRGVYIVIVDIQRSMPIERLTAQSKEAWFAHLHQLLPAGAKFAYLTSPSYNNDTLYCDGSHLNPAGQRRFTSWWSPELERIQKEGR